MKYIVDIHGEINGDYEIIKKYDEPKTGKWIRREDGMLPIICECSVCGFDTINFELFSFCPICGCRMEEGDSE